MTLTPVPNGAKAFYVARRTRCIAKTMESGAKEKHSSFREGNQTWCLSPKEPAFDPLAKGFYLKRLPAAREGALLAQGLSQSLSDGPKLQGVVYSGTLGPSTFKRPIIFVAVPPGGRSRQHGHPGSRYFVLAACCALQTANDPSLGNI